MLGVTTVAVNTTNNLLTIMLMLKLSVLLSLRNFLDAKLLHVLGVCKLFRQKVEKRRESGRFFRQTLFFVVTMLSFG